MSKSSLKHFARGDGICELRVKAKEAGVRIFCFFDKGNLVVQESPFSKKTQGTPKPKVELSVPLE